MSDKTAIIEHFKGNWNTFYSRYLPTLQKIGGNEYRAKCPFHEDDNPSFNFNNKDGKYFCHACAKGGDPLDFYGRVNSLDTRIDFVRILNGIAKDFGIENGNGGRHHDIVATYDYLDERGKRVRIPVKAASHSD